MTKLLICYTLIVFIATNNYYLCFQRHVHCAPLCALYHCSAYVHVYATPRLGGPDPGVERCNRQCLFDLLVRQAGPCQFLHITVQ